MNQAQEFRANGKAMSVDGSADTEQVFDAMNLMSAVNNLTAVCHGAAARAGWWIDSVTGQDVRQWPEHLFKLWVSAKLALCHSELSEALEGLRKDKADEHLPHRKSFEVEMADTLIRIFDLMGGLQQFDLAGAVVEKMHYNAQRADHKPENRQAEGGKSF